MAMTQRRFNGKTTALADQYFLEKRNEDMVAAFWDHVEPTLIFLFHGMKMTSKEMMDLHGFVFNSCYKMSYGIQFYTDLKEFVENLLAGIIERSKKKRGVELLSFYNYEWQKFKNASMVVDWAFEAFRKSVLQRELDELNVNVHWIYVQCLLSWREKVFYSIQERLTSTCVGMIEMNELKNGTLRGLVEDVVKSYVELFVGVHSYDLKHTYPRSMTKTEIWERFEEYKQMSSNSSMLWGDEQVAAIQKYASTAENLLKHVFIFENMDVVIKNVDYDQEEEDEKDEDSSESWISKFLSYFF